MFEMPVRSVMRRRQILKAPPRAIISKAAKLMAAKNVGAIMVVEDKRLVGIFTERDVVFRVVAAELDVHTTRLADVMTPAPHTIEPDEPFAYALLVMHENGFRHLPVIQDGKPIRIVSARSAMERDLEEFASEAQRRKHFREKMLQHTPASTLRLAVNQEKLRRPRKR